jgi:hypothetical protein
VQASKSLPKRQHHGTNVRKEVTTGNGTLVELWGNPTDVEKAAEVLSLLEKIELPHTQWESEPETRRHKKYSRFDIVEHTVGGCDAFYHRHLLEIRSAPPGKASIVIDHYVSFTEWSDLASAKKAYRKMIDQHLEDSDLEKNPLPGQLRLVKYHQFDPWFYAIGNQLVVGDIAFPDNLQEDPVYRAGKDFVVYDEENQPSIKTCLGCRLERYQEQHGFREETPHVHFFRLVYFDDGTTWNESTHRENPPRPLVNGELWMTKAVEQFKACLAQGRLGFSLSFVDGLNFKCRLTGKKGLTVEGSYYAEITFTDGTEEKGYFDFKPFRDFPTVEDYLKFEFGRQRKEIKTLKVELYRRVRLGKGWSGGLFLDPTPSR